MDCFCLILFIISSETGLEFVNYPVYWIFLVSLEFSIVLNCPTVNYCVKELRKWCSWHIWDLSHIYLHCNFEGTLFVGTSFHGLGKKLSILGFMNSWIWNSIRLTNGQFPFIGNQISWLTKPTKIGTLWTIILKLLIFFSTRGVGMSVSDTSCIRMVIQELLKQIF